VEYKLRRLDQKKKITKEDFKNKKTKKTKERRERGKRKL